VNTPRTERSNEAWLDALRGAEPDALADLAGLVAGALRKALRPRRLDDATLDDLGQVAVLQVLEKLDHFEGRSRFTTWAWSVAVRAAMTELRRPVYRTGDGDDALPEVATDAAGPAATAERQDVVDALYRVIEHDLTERQRTAVLGELRGRPQEELLDELGIDRNALYKLRHDARRKLRAGLGAAGICDVAVREALGLPSQDAS
jgi:RNA polymerase sigma-70 factor (ECF subfamily)